MAPVTRDDASDEERAVDDEVDGSTGNEVIMLKAALMTRKEPRKTDAVNPDSGANDVL